MSTSSSPGSSNRKAKGRKTYDSGNDDESEREKSNKLDDIKNVFSKNINRFIEGGKNLFPNFMTAEKLKRLRKTGGDAAISFSQFK
jgi:hypothetical protein